MPVIIEVILGLGLAAGFAAAVQLWRRSLAVGRREDLQALAARRGWSFTVTDARLGRGAHLRLAPRGGHPWTLESGVVPAAGGPVTEYVADEPRWADGTLVAAPGTPEGVARLLGPDLARQARGVSPRPSPIGIALLSDADPALRMIPDDVARALAEWPDPVPPVLILGPEGLRLRLRGTTDRADRIERLVDLAFDLSRLIGP